MLRSIKIGIKGKIIFTIIPVLICSFTIFTFVSVFSSRQNLFYESNRFTKYKLEQLTNYSTNQWDNLQNSNFADDPVYINIIEKSIETYAKDMIRKKSESIFAIDTVGKLIFSTSNINYNQEDWVTLRTESTNSKEGLTEFIISGEKFLGLSSFSNINGLYFFIVENKKVFMEKTQQMTFLQIFTSLISLIVIIVILIMYLGIMLGPIQRVRKAIHNITTYKDFSRKVRIEYPDEIGELAFDFNDMTSNLDLAYKKLKKHAVDEAIAKKEIFIREKETLNVLGNASDYKDPETGAHIARVSNYSLLISKALGQDIAIQDLLYHTAPLHDIGKLGIPDSILLKAGKLTEEEFFIIKTHTTIGFNILKNSSSKYLKAGAVIAKTHHERFDGSGYPNGLKGTDIPVFGRIVSIADVFDALTTKRPYKEAWPFEKTMDFIMDNRGNHFDPDMANLFFQNLTEVKDIYNHCTEESL
ncbi:MAG: hypothetical protein DRP58_01825 [Spirochaetes bacterium]|nr:MAG: hypothetical protein DRP58_01825 [Spirochaetota bacterium]